LVVESIRWGEGETTVESDEGEITLKVERRESKFETVLRDGAS
jgi:hypothetical protein